MGESSHLSRRELLASAGAVALVSASGVAARAQDAKAAVPGVTRVGPGPVEVAFTLNGKATTVAVEPRVTLLDALRDRIGATGTKRVCDRGVCGACTIWLDGKVANACMILAVDAAGAQVTTIEGLASGDRLHPVQQAFCEQDALQCGFCTPGMVMSCAALLARTPKPTDDQVRAAVAGNLCRCGTYPHVLAAVRQAAGAGK